MSEVQTNFPISGRLRLERLRGGNALLFDRTTKESVEIERADLVPTVDALRSYIQGEDTTGKTVVLNTCSITNTLRDFATLLRTGSTKFVINSLDSLASRIEEMSND